MTPTRMTSLLLFIWTIAMVTESGAAFRKQYRIIEEVQKNSVVGDIPVDSGLKAAFRDRPDLVNSFQYAILRGLHKEHFFIDRNEGYLRAKDTLDREQMCPRETTCETTLEVAVVQPSDHFQLIQVIIEILDRNDNTPTFPEATFHLQVSENTNPGAKFIIPAAQDLDSDLYGIQRYRLTSDTATFALKVNDERGGMVDLELILVEALDRETVSGYRLQITAEDGGRPPKTGAMDIVIEVVDTNDNTPVFSNDMYELSTPEDMSTGTTLVSVFAFDSDQGQNARVNYTFVDFPRCTFTENWGVDFTHEQECQFRINADTGDVILTQPLDYETVTSHLLLVVAQDHGPGAVPAYAKVVINVQDVNDVAPLITVKALKAPSTDAEADDTDMVQIVNIEENQPKGTFVAYVSVEDQDGDQSGDVICSMTDRATFTLQEMYNNEYKIITSRVLDREVVDQYDVAITCDDYGTPRLRSRYSLTIKVNDVNDNRPIFSRPVYKANIRENNAVNTSLLRVVADDSDVGDNALVTYHIHSAYSGILSVERHTGVVRAKISFDREATDTVDAQILAIDRGRPLLTGTASISLTILDLNDNAPVFTSDVYTFGVDENLPHNTEVGTLSASDTDADPYSRYTFSLRAYNSTDILPFVIDRYDGRISTTRLLDRELASVHYLLATVTDVDDDTLTSTVLVTVYVADKNDNPPVMVFPTTSNDTVVVSSSITPGTRVCHVRARDPDAGTNAELRYFILHGNDWQLWHLDAVSGAVTYLGSDFPVTQDQHVLVVGAEDMGIPEMSATSQLTILFNHTIVHLAPDSGHKSEQEVKNSGVSDQGGLGPEMQYRIILVLAIVTTFIVLVLVAIIVILRRRQLREKRRKRHLAAVASTNKQDQTYLFVNNHKDNAGSGFVKGVPEPDETMYKEAEVPHDGTSLLDLDLSSSGISMGSEGVPERVPVTQQAGQYHLSPPQLQLRYAADWLHSFHGNLKGESIEEEHPRETDETPEGTRTESFNRSRRKPEMTQLTNIWTSGVAALDAHAQKNRKRRARSRHFNRFPLRQMTPLITTI